MAELNIQELLNLAVKYHNQGDLKQAETIYKNILEKQENPDALHLLGVIAYQTGNYEDSVKNISRAIELKQEAVYYHNLAITYDALNKEKESVKNYEKALSISNYDNAYLAHYNLGIYYKDKKEFEKSLEHFNKSIELNDFPEAHWNKSLVLLTLGRFEEGWKEYSYRFKKKNPTDSRVFNKPEYNKQENIKLLIISEQGFGDNINFIRYLKLIKNNHIILECKKELKRLFENLNINEFTENAKDTEYDYYIHLMDLPRIFNSTINDLPEFKLTANNKLVEEFKQNTNKFKIGIAYHGNPRQDNNKNRSTSLEKFNILKIPGVQLYSLQKDSEEIPGIITFNLNDFAETAAIIENLDLIISVDTSVAHLAGSLGKPVWLLLCFNPDWRWLINREDSIWYPNMRLFRQRKPGDWNSLFKEVKPLFGSLLYKGICPPSKPR